MFYLHQIALTIVKYNDNIYYCFDCFLSFFDEVNIVNIKYNKSRLFNLRGIEKDGKENI